MMDSQNREMLMQAKAIMDSYKIYYGVNVLNVKEEKGIQVVYIEIPKNIRGNINGEESANIAKLLKDNLNELLKSFGVDTSKYFFKVKYKTV